MTDTAASPPPARGLSRWGRRALIASLALNLLIIGFAASAMWRHRKETAFSGNAINANLLGFTQTLPAERRQALWRQTAAERRSMRPLRGEVRAARMAVRSVFLTEPFNAAEFAKAQERLFEAETRARKEAQRLFLGVANALTKEERAAFARWQPEEASRPFGRKRWWKQDQPDRDTGPSPTLVPGSTNSTVPVTTPR